MSSVTRTIVFWTPRILTILFILFLGLFALDVFAEGQGFFRTLGALLVHLVPNLLMVGILILAWRWEWVGTLLFGALALLYILLTLEQGHWSWWLGISGPLFLLAILFLVNWIYHDDVRGKPSSHP